MGGDGERDCHLCHHPYDPHAVVAVEFAAAGGREVPVGGYITCPEPDCGCRLAWSLVQLPPPGGEVAE